MVVKKSSKKSFVKPIISLQDVWKSYSMGVSTVHALRGLNLDVFPGEFLAVQGPSGSGKSTAMNLIGCLDVPSKGSIILDGNNISSLSESSLAQIRGRNIGFVFQKFNLIPMLPAIENVALPLVFQGVSEFKRLILAKNLLVRLGLGDRLYHKPSELSGGQQQRVAIARSLIADPPVILADEPTGNLDSVSGKDVFSLLVELHSKGKTVVLVTHDDSLASRAERVAFLKDGVITSIKTSVKKFSNRREV